MAFLTLEAHMLFYLDHDLLKDAVVNIARLTEFLEDLCAARSNGRHLIFSEKKTIEALLVLPDLRPRAHRTLSAV